MEQLLVIMYKAYWASMPYSQTVRSLYRRSVVWMTQCMRVLCDTIFSPCYLCLSSMAHCIAVHLFHLHHAWLIHLLIHFERALYYHNSICDKIKGMSHCQQFSILSFQYKLYLSIWNAAFWSKPNLNWTSSCRDMNNALKFLNNVQH